MLGAWADREPAGGIRGVGAGGPPRARSTVSAGEGAGDDGLTALVVRRLPFDTGVPRRAGGPLRVPVQGKVGHVEACGRACVPGLIAWRRSHHVDAVGVPTGHHLRRVHITAVDDVLRGQATLPLGNATRATRAVSSGTTAVVQSYCRDILPSHPLRYTPPRFSAWDHTPPFRDTTPRSHTLLYAPPFTNSINFKVHPLSIPRVD